MKLLALGASTSAQSINRQLATYSAALVRGGEVTVLDLSTLSAPLYSVDEEARSGIPQAAKDLLTAIEASDAIILSLAEHNGSYAAAFKNLFDWATRAKQKVWSDKPMFLLSTSPGGRGGATVLAAAKGSFPHLGGKIVSTFSLPSFQDNFVEGGGIKDPELRRQFEAALLQFTTAL